MSYRFAPAIIITVLVVFGFIGYLVAGRKSGPLPRFLIRYLGALTLLLLIEAALLWQYPTFHMTLRGWAASVVGAIMRLFNEETYVTGSTLLLRNPLTIFEVTAASLGGPLLWAYVALVLADSRWTRPDRARGLIIGLAILFLCNLARLILSAYLEWRTETFASNYLYLVNLALVLLVWAGWVQHLKPRLEAPPRQVLLWPSRTRSLFTPDSTPRHVSGHPLRDRAQELAALLRKYEHWAREKGVTSISPREVEACRATLQDVDKIMRKVETSSPRLRNITAPTGTPRRVIQHRSAL
ncbi:MAG: hypothetical protein DRI39_09390 [Chloroflexi bacterium]|nr:MAG: hypothetical protein DRI39_09390 [Chloroflexota bacterium]